MSWELDSIKENEADKAKYKREVYNDYVEQFGENTLMVEDDKSLKSNFIDFLLTRMYYEGIPSKEPRI
jgi:hypothetical protein